MSRPKLFGSVANSSFIAGTTPCFDVTVTLPNGNIVVTAGYTGGGLTGFIVCYQFDPWRLTLSLQATAVQLAVGLNTFTVDVEALGRSVVGLDYTAPTLSSSRGFAVLAVTTSDGAIAGFADYVPGTGLLSVTLDVLGAGVLAGPFVRVLVHIDYTSTALTV